MASSRSDSKFCSSLSTQQGLRVLLALGLGVAGLAKAAVINVTNTADSGAGSLRAAITSANASATVDSIAFLIPGAGPHVISPASPLPSITQPVTIDGYTQAGALENTLAEGSNAVIKIQIDGALAGATTTGIGVCSSNVTIRGLSITDFTRQGIAFGQTTAASACAGSPFTAGVVAGNFIGLDPLGAADGNSFVGVLAQDSTVAIGSANVADRNVIGANGSNGIQFSDGANGTVDGNLIGTNPTGLVDRGNSFSGIAFVGNGVPIASAGASAPNVIRFNREGIRVGSANIGVSIFNNRFSDNDTISIDLVASGANPDGLTNNDLNDADSGGNSLQNFPVLASVQRFASSFSVQGTLDRPTGASPLIYTITLYASASCDGNNHGPGVRVLDSRAIVLANGSSESFSYAVTNSNPLYLDMAITATATDSSGNTSEMSACQAVTEGAGAIVVTNTDDTGVGSLRDAIALADATAGANVIVFNIPGAGPHSIVMSGAPFEIIDQPVLIDGYSQPGATLNTLTTQASNAVLKIEIDGGALGSLQEVFDANAPVTVQGIAFKRIASSAGAIGEFGSADGTRVRGNFFGMDAAGVPQPQRQGRGVFVNAETLIGGTDPADRNVFGNVSEAVRVFGAGIPNTVVEGNSIGVAPNGITALAVNCGISVATNSGTFSGTRIGGVLPNQGNSILSDGGCGAVDVTGSGTTDVRVLGNAISSIGVSASSARTGMGIDLGADGVTSNDINDADSGENDLQNAPVLALVQSAGGNLRVVGSLDVPTPVVGARYTLSIYRNSSCDARGFGDGNVYLGSQDISLTHLTTPLPILLEQFEVALPGTLPVGTVITATATSPTGSTSEFSACTTVATDDTMFRSDFEG